jgi:MFS family permease
LYGRWIILAISCIGGLLASIQSSALIIAFPKLLTDLDASIVNIIWVLLAYLLVVAAIVPVTGKLGDIFGQQLLFNFGFLFFTIASLLSGFSQKDLHGTDLIGYRCVLGLGGTFLFSNSVAIITK